MVGVLSVSLKIAHVLPTHRKEVTKDPSLYRPVSLTSACCRAMERIINKLIPMHVVSGECMASSEETFGYLFVWHKIK